MNTLELLAPAGNAAIGLAAINCGADAVYIGAPKFGAREAAGNSVADIAALARYAHRYNAKVYIALNTILSDDEIPQAVRLAEQLWEAGADALIIQDMGLLEAGLPPIPLHLSTQGNCDTPGKAAFYAKLNRKKSKTFWLCTRRILILQSSRHAEFISASLRFNEAIKQLLNNF